MSQREYKKADPSKAEGYKVLIGVMQRFNPNWYGWDPELVAEMKQICECENPPTPEPGEMENLRPLPSHEAMVDLGISTEYGFPRLEDAKRICPEIQTYINFIDLMSAAIKRKPGTPAKERPTIEGGAHKLIIGTEANLAAHGICLHAYRHSWYTMALSLESMCNDNSDVNTDSLDLMIVDSLDIPSCPAWMQTVLLEALRSRVKKGKPTIVAFTRPVEELAKYVGVEISELLTSKFHTINLPVKRVVVEIDNQPVRSGADMVPGVSSRKFALNRGKVSR